MPNIREHLGSMLEPIPVRFIKHKMKIHLAESDLKDIKDWDVGKVYVVELRVKMIGKHIIDKKVEGDFEVTKVENETEDEEEEGEPLTSGAKNYGKKESEKEDEDEDEH